MKRITSGTISLASTASLELVKQGIDLFFQRCVVTNGKDRERY